MCGAYRATHGGSAALTAHHPEDATYLYAWHDSFVNATWLICKCDMTHVWRVPRGAWRQCGAHHASYSGRQIRGELDIDLTYTYTNKIYTYISYVYTYIHRIYNIYHTYICMHVCVSQINMQLACHTCNSHEAFHTHIESLSTCHTHVIESLSTGVYGMSRTWYSTHIICNTQLHSYTAIHSYIYSIDPCRKTLYHMCMTCWKTLYQAHDIAVYYIDRLMCICHIWMSHVTYERCHIWTSHVTYEWVISCINEVCVLHRPIDVHMYHIYHTYHIYWCAYISYILMCIHIIYIDVHTYHIWVYVIHRYIMCLIYMICMHINIYDMYAHQYIWYVWYIRYICTSIDVKLAANSTSICHTHTHIYLHTSRIFAYIHTCMHACMHTWRHTYRQMSNSPRTGYQSDTHIHAYLHTYIHTYIHVCVHRHTYI